MLGAHIRADFPPETLAARRPGGRQLLVDAQGLVRAETLGPLVRDSRVPPESFASVRALKLNDAEAEALAGGTDPQSIRRLCVPEVVLTLGSRKSVVVTATLSEQINAVPVAGRIDPTGAGDMFWVSYLPAVPTVPIRSTPLAGRARQLRGCFPARSHRRAGARSRASGRLDSELAAARVGADEVEAFLAGV